MAGTTFKKQKRVEKILNDFAKRVVKMARKNLSTRQKVASGVLHSSLGHEIKWNRKVVANNLIMGDPDFKWTSAKHGRFINNGVSGTETTYPNASGRFHHLGTGRPMIQSIEKWIARKGIQGRSKKGKFITRKSLAFAIAKHVKKVGIKPTNFFTDAFESVYREMSKSFIRNYGEDMLEALQHTFEKVKYIK